MAQPTAHWDLTFTNIGQHTNAAHCWRFLLPEVPGALLWLRSLGIKQGSRLGLAGSNSPSTAALLQAAPLAGATTVLFNRRLTAVELTQQLHHAAIDVLIAEPTHPLAAQSHLIPSPFEQHELGDVTPLHDDDPALVIFTSGTSGTAKAARLHWSAIRHAADAATQVLDLSSQRAWLGCLPLDHIGGASIIYRAGRSGNSVVLCERFDPHQVNNLLDNHAVNNYKIYGISVVPTMLSRLINERQHRPWPTQLQYLLTGGGPVAPALIEQSTTMGLPPNQTYGLTEAASQVTTLLPTDAKNHSSSAGTPVPGTEIRIKDGIIEIRGPTLFAGYETNGKISEPHKQTEWFSTGDIGTSDANGFLTVHARRSDLIISGGENIYPAEVEAVLEQHPDIAEAGVYGISDSEWGHIVGVMLVASHAPLTDEALTTYCEQKLARFKQPKKWKWVAALPRTATGKLQRHLLSILSKSD